MKGLPAVCLRSESDFMLTNVPLFLQRFSLSYVKEDSCIEYFLKDIASSEIISTSLVFSCNPLTRDLHVSKFYPDLNLEPDSRYMSAVCFYLLIHHCADSYSVDESCRIILETVPDVSENFYGKLRDFDFHVRKAGLGNVVELVSSIVRLPVNTAMIKAHVFREDEIPFMK